MNSSYDDIVSKSNQAIEGVMIAFGIIIAIAFFVSVVVVIVLSIRSKKTFDKNVQTMVDNLKKAEKADDKLHECRYCGNLIEDVDICPNCGAKQFKDN